MYDSSLPPVPVLEGIKKQSRMGIASFVLGILSVVILCIGMVITINYAITLGLENPTLTDPYALVDQASPALIASSALIYCSPVISLVGVCLGIATLVQKKDKKILGTIGLVLNGLLFLGVCLLLAFALVMAAGSLSV